MRIAVSFTMTLMNMHKGLVTLAEIDELHAGCTRGHLFPAGENLVPHEVSWLDPKPPGFRSWHTENGNEIPPDLCHPEAMKTWLAMKQWIVAKDAEGKVKYSVGNYPELCRKLLKEGHEVWYDGEWQKIENFRWAEV